MIDLYISVKELAAAVKVCRTKLFFLKKQGLLSKPIKWCGSKKSVYSLRTACREIALLNKVAVPTDETIEFLASKIVDARNQQVAK